MADDFIALASESRCSRFLDSAPIGRNSVGLLWAVDVLLYPRSLLVSFPALGGNCRAVSGSITSGGAGPRSGIGWFGTAPNRLS